MTEQSRTDGSLLAPSEKLKRLTVVSVSFAIFVSSCSSNHITQRAPSQPCWCYCDFSGASFIGQSLIEDCGSTTSEGETAGQLEEAVARVVWVSTNVHLHRDERAVIEGLKLEIEDETRSVKAELSRVCEASIASGRHKI